MKLPVFFLGKILGSQAGFGFTISTLHLGASLFRPLPPNGRQVFLLASKNTSKLLPKAPRRPRLPRVNRQVSDAASSAVGAANDAVDAVNSKVQELARSRVIQAEWEFFEMGAVPQGVLPLQFLVVGFS